MYRKGRGKALTRILIVCLVIVGLMQLLFHRAAHGPAAPQIAVLKAHLADYVSQLVPRRTPTEYAARQSCEGGTPLHWAAMCNQVAVVEQLLSIAKSQDSLIPSPNSKNTASKGLLEQMLLAQDDHGRTALHVAAGRGNTEV